MSKIHKRRVLSDSFMNDLKFGFLNPLLKRVVLDTTLDLEIRENYINIYYQGGNLLRLKPKSKKEYSAFFDFKYFKGAGLKPLELPEIILNRGEIELWINSFALLKNGMDLYLGKKKNHERAFQQILVSDNNGNKNIAHGTDYFISDIEYAVEYEEKQNARFDALAILWRSTSTARKLQKGYLPRLTLIEMKYGDSALKGKSGMVDHLTQYKKFFKDSDKVDALKNFVIKQFQQKRDLGLVPALNSNSFKITKLDDIVDVMFVLANHKPTDTKLQKELLVCQEMNVKFRVLFSQANFHGYGLYENNMYSVENIISR